MKDLLLYMYAINMITFIMFWYDKDQARKGRWRIPERTLLFLAALGGSLGALVAMYGIHHKTRHKKFTVGVPLLLALQLFVLIFGKSHFQ